MSRQIVRSFLYGVVAMICILAIAISIAMHQEPLYPGFSTDSGYLDSSLSNQSESKDVFLPLTLEGMSTALRRFACVVSFLPTTQAHAPRVRTPRARCDVVSKTHDVLLNGDFWEGLSGSSTRTMTWNAASTSLGVIVSQPIMLRVHMETDPGDKIYFSGVWVEGE